MGIKNDAFAGMPEPMARNNPMYTDQAGNAIDLEAEFAGQAADDEAGGELPPDIDMMSSDEWAALASTPEGKKARSLLAQRKSAIDHMQASFGEQFAAMQAQVNALSSNKAENGSGRGSPYADASDSEIKTWMDNAKLLRQRAAIEPDNAALQAEAAKVNDSTLDALQDELLERRLERKLEERMAPLAAQSEAARLEAQIGRQLAAAGVSTDALSNESNPMRLAALQRADRVAKALGVTNADSKAKAVAVTFAMLLEHELAAERSRAGRGLPAGVRRQLDIEGASRRAAAGASVGSGGNRAATSEVAKMRKIANFVSLLS